MRTICLLGFATSLFFLFSGCSDDSGQTPPADQGPLLYYDGAHGDQSAGSDQLIIKLGDGSVDEGATHDGAEADAPHGGDGSQVADAGSPADTTHDVWPTPTCRISTGTSTTMYTQSAPGGEVTVTWSSTHAASCNIRHKLPDGSWSVTDPWATGLSGSQAAYPTIVGVHWWVIECQSVYGPCSSQVGHQVVDNS